MANSYKILGQLNPSANTQGNVYVFPLTNYPYSGATVTWFNTSDLTSKKYTVYTGIPNNSDASLCYWNQSAGSQVGQMNDGNLIVDIDYEKYVKQILNLLDQNNS